MTRFTTVYRKLEEQQVKLPEEVQGWFLIRKLKLDQSQESMLLTATGGSYKYSKVCGSVKAIFANARGVIRNKDTFAADVYTATSDAGTVSTDFDDEDDMDQEALDAAAEMAQEEENYDEEWVLETFETYQQIRKKVQDSKRARGFRSQSSSMPGGSQRGGGGAFSLKGSIVAKLEQVKARTRCHTCGQLGHWKRECPRRGSTGSGTSTNKSSGNKEVMIVEDGMYDEDDLDALFQRLSAADGTNRDWDAMMVQVEEPVADGALSPKEPSQSGVTSDHHFGDNDFKSFSSVYRSQNAAEDYMAPLDRHGVPDTACRRSLVGARVLEQLEEHVRGLGEHVVRRKCKSAFKFGNTGELVSYEVA